VAVQNSTPVLSLVMPAYNEEGAIRDVIVGWDTQLAALGVPYEMRVYDDGSRDGTGTLLEALARERPNLVAIRKPNSGHGPTILRGYREARGEWVFQVDSDDEMSWDAFPSVWSRRGDADLVFGYRVERESPAARRLITIISRMTVRLLFGAGVRDVNTPYRLFRRTLLTRLLRAVPPDAFAPNVILSGLAIRAGARIIEVPVPHRGRRTGATHIVRLKMWKAALTSFGQTVRAALAARRGIPS
jgi:glycosyltransferase involved in cell wall biosynthesis